MAGQTDAMPPQSELFVAPCILATVREWTDCSAVIIPLQMFAQNGMTGGLSSNSTPCVCVFVMNMISKVGLRVDGAVHW